MKKTLLTLILLSASLQASASSPLTPAQEARVQELVKETLLSHPEILVAAADKLDRQNAEAGQEQLKHVISQYNDFIFHDPNSPRIGAQNPKLTLVVFTDYNCPYCKKFDPYLEKIVEKYPEVAVIFKFLPWRSESSVTSARDALTLWRTHPQQFMKFNHILMAKKGYHDTASIEEAKKKAGVIVDTPDEQSLETIKKSFSVAEKLGIQGTPATLIGDDMLSGWIPYEQFDAMVSDALKKQ
ncbi:Disulfide bond formation protein D [Klebsiella spallanzanii]|jgi:protein-disulfide isomerase|uniref:Disulfide bond formation protein D n=1 Tax=Klebsiella spallanzanii TaxID=2587528 RepID=A0A564GQD4_9ENTR|nr:DsbA family protein [Klebsiella spallanzanii]MDM4209479.1 DsbA family protein [Klebsiella spallanzanii]VUS21988.1 Disulfide bond formation protein D [Klebsiella spallanzanii]VUT04309.1 Disulfide bond formation protein D [Klebsiella spallanzanii]